MLLQQKLSFCFNLFLAHFVLCTLLLFKRIYQGFDLFLQTSFLPSTLFNFQDPIASLKLPLDSAFIVYHIRSRLSSPFFSNSFDSRSLRSFSILSPSKLFVNTFFPSSRIFFQYRLRFSALPSRTARLYYHIPLPFVNLFPLFLLFCL